MVRVSRVDSEGVYVEDPSGHMLYDRFLFDFNPQVGDPVKVIKNYDGTIMRISYDVTERKIKSANTIKLVIAIYSIAFGIVSFLGQFQLEESNPYTFILVIAIVGSGIFMLARDNEKLSYNASITNFVVYCICMFFSLFIFFINPALALLSFVFYGIPFVLGIIYLVKMKDIKFNRY